MLAAQTARAVDPWRTISQCVRERWTTENGFPRGPVYSINQTPDGYLWIGSEAGLIRFDGVTFRLMQSRAPELSPLSHVLALVADREGNLWARLRRPTLLRYRSGEFQDAMSTLGAAQATVAAISLGHDGDLLVWALKGEPQALVLRDQHFESLAAPLDFSRSPVLAMAQTANGDIWLGTRDAGLFRITSGKTVNIKDSLPDLKVNALAPFGTSELWVATDSGIARWDGTRLVTDGPVSALRGLQALTLLLDRDSNLWVGTNSNGLARINAKGVSWLDGQGDRHQSAGHEAVTALFEDREGNLWTGTASGLERIRDSRFVSYSQPEGLPSERTGPVWGDGSRIWFAPIAGGLGWIGTGGEIGTISEGGLRSDVVYSIAGGKQGVWIGRQHGGLTQLRPQKKGFASVTYTAASGLAQNSVYSVFESSDGSVWAGTLSGGVSRFSEGRFKTYTAADGLASNTVTSIAQTTDGTMWFGTPNGLTAFPGLQWKSFGVADGLTSANVNCLLVDSASLLWIGTARGLTYLKDGKLRSAGTSSVALRDQIFGIAEDRNGSLWLTTSDHVLEVKKEKLITGNLTEGDVHSFTLADGLRGTEGVKRSRSVISDPAGRIWLSTSRGISVIDPGRIRRNSAPATVDIQSVTADGAPIELAKSLHIPGGHRRLTIQYAGLSLSIPERIRYRYMLEGFEKEWSKPVQSRETVYTNLSPGHYRFRVIAGTADGLWSDRETALAFAIDPRFWETWWFWTLGVVLSVATALVLYRLRLRQIARRLNFRFEERLAERTRIAQELHDTLLQGFLSASMQVHVANDGLPADSQARPILTRALERMRQVIEEGRNAVRGLRSSSSESLDLENAFSMVREELGPLVNADVDFRVIVDGQQRSLHPLLRDEVYRIGREALVNAFRHSGANHIEVELRYSRSQFRVFIRDDGAGIAPQVIESGRDGHWGMAGMQERADKIGAQLHVLSRQSAGTEIELAVPGRLAFPQKQGKWNRRIHNWRSKKPDRSRGAE